MFKYVLVIMIILAGCTQNKNELSEPKSSIGTKYGELKINSSKIYFKGKEIDFEGWDPFEIVQYWKLKEKILVLVSHANTNRCEQRYRIVTIDNIGAHSSKSFGNCDVPKNLSLDGNTLKIKFERTNWSPEVNVEYDNYNLVVSEVKPKNFDNFMIGLCQIEGDENLKKCSIDEAKNLDAFTTAFTVFNKTEVVTYVVFGREYYKSTPPQFRKKDVILSAPVTYVETAETNKIWVKMNGENGCIFTNEYSKVGNRIHIKPIAINGNCSKTQTSFFENELKDGSKQIRYLK